MYHVIVVEWPWLVYSIVLLSDFNPKATDTISGDEVAIMATFGHTGKFGSAEESVSTYF